MSQTPTPVEEQELPLPADFDINSWIAGIQATVRSTNIYARADLIGEIEALEAQLRIVEAAAADEAGLDEASEASALREQITELQQAFVASGITFKVQGRSENWLLNVEKEFKNHADTNGMSKEDKAVYVQLHQLAGSIVQPVGVTYDHLAQLREASEAQVRKLLVSFSLACNQAPQVTVPFSQRPSDSRRTRRP